jgi:uncharacterized protein (DUF1697 family)
VATYIALLRAVNLAGRNPVAMADLRGLVTALGFFEPRTLLQSGNVIFRGRAKSPVQLERMLEQEARSRMKLDTEFFVRTPDELSDLIERNPFPKEAARDPGYLLVTFLKSATDAARVKALQAAIVGREIVRGDGRHCYIVYPDGQGRSRLTTAVIEKHLGARGTARNWNTVLKLRALSTEPKSESEA